MSRLSERMLVAAAVLEEASELYEAYDATRYSWCAEDLRREAVHVESGEDDQ